MQSDPSGDDLAADLTAAGRGDRSAFRRVYQATAPRLLAICLKVTRDRPAAEDVLQGVFIKVWQTASRFDGERGRSMAWLGSIARNAAIDWYRAQRPHRVEVDRPPDTIQSETEPADVRMIREEREDEAMTLVEGLSEDIGFDVKRIYLQGMTYEQAARSEGVPVGTLKSKIRRALIGIRTKLQDG